MARIHSTTKLATPTSSKSLQRDEDVPDIVVVGSTGLISKVMKAITEMKKQKVVEATEEESALDVKEDIVEEEDNDLRPTKPSYINIGWSTIQPSDLELLKRLGYIDSDDVIRYAVKETPPEPKEDEIVVFESFFQARLQLPMFRMIAEVLKSMRFTCTNWPQMQQLDLMTTYGLYEANVFKQMLELSIGFTSCTIDEGEAFRQNP